MPMSGCFVRRARWPCIRDTVELRRSVTVGVGEGIEINGPIQALVMLLAGRTATIPQLTGL
jgi:hypothetical protein